MNISYIGESFHFFFFRAIQTGPLSQVLVDCRGELHPIEIRLILGFPRIAFGHVEQSPPEICCSGLGF